METGPTIPSSVQSMVGAHLSTAREVGNNGQWVAWMSSRCLLEARGFLWDSQGADMDATAAHISYGNNESAKMLCGCMLEKYLAQ